MNHHSSIASETYLPRAQHTQAVPSVCVPNTGKVVQVGAPNVQASPIIIGCLQRLVAVTFHPLHADDQRTSAESLL